MVGEESERTVEEEETDVSTSDGAESKDKWWKLKAFLVYLVVDAVGSLILLPPFWPWSGIEGDADTTQFGLNLADVGVLSTARLLAAIVALMYSFLKAEVPPDNYPFDLHQPNGTKKTKEELDSEALEEPFWPWAKRFAGRPSFAAEFFCVLTQLVGVAKCLSRMYIEIGVMHGSAHRHPVFWLAVLWVVTLSVVQACYLEEICRLAGVYGKEQENSTPAMLRTLSNQLFEPLLADNTNGDIEQTDEETPDESPQDDQAVAVADITSETNYKAKASDLLLMCLPDIHMIMLAFIFLLLAAVAQVFIPVFLGKILDSLQVAFGKDGNKDIDMWDIPHFMEYVQLLVVASILAGVFSGMRGSLFTLVGARVNVRLRVKLMDSLLAQDIGFFDITKTGDITSRLSSDTTLVGDQVSLNVNVFLRSVVQALGVLLFMFWYSWQLSIVAFISVPLITVLSKWYGEYVRKIIRIMQKKLADGNAVSEAALSSMSTVRTFDAAELELKEFEGFMSTYLDLNTKSAIAYCGYATIATSLPELIFAVVVFFGGLLVRNGDMTIGMLVSFLLYLQSLSDAFSTLGWVFSSLTQAIGAADKVFELLHREPNITPPASTCSPPPDDTQSSTGILGIEATKTRAQRVTGLRPESPQGKVELDHVELFYPARPKRKILDNLSLTVEPGSTVALVGQSGGGKSSVMSLIQHLYEPTNGEVRMDGIKVCDLSPQWLSRQISVVSQEPTLFARSIKRNIIYGLEGTDEEPSDEDVLAAARLANADNFIQEMPSKYDTEVGERGVQLSGGQKQRIAIARALVRHPRVLLLDEATSALDAESEYLVQQAIDGMLKRGKSQDNPMTVIIVAHRLSTIQSADKIFVVKDGKVVESGTHSDLIRCEDGPYANLIQRQRNAQNALLTESVSANDEDGTEAEDFSYSNHD